MFRAIKELQEDVRILKASVKQLECEHKDTDWDTYRGSSYTVYQKVCKRCGKEVWFTFLKKEYLEKLKAEKEQELVEIIEQLGDV